MKSSTMYIKNDLTRKEIAEIVNLSMDGTYVPQISINVEKDRPKVKKLVQNHSDR